MIHIESFVFNDRKQAGSLLAKKLSRFMGTNAVVIAVPYGGAVVGFHVSSQLNIPFDVLPCEKITHPADKTRSIGSISPDDVTIHDDGHDIPRNYIYHQIVVNQTALKVKRSF